MWINKVVEPKKVFFVENSGEMWFLWCPEHGTFWSEGKYDKCVECGYQANTPKLQNEVKSDKLSPS